jgi:hypothetical protein
VRIVRSRLLAAIVIVAAGCSRGRDPGTIACTPGTAILIGCSSACGVGSCTGDPLLRVCDGTSARACADGAGFLAESDDSCGTRCPSVRVTCPPGGNVAVVHRGWRDGEYACAWEAQLAPTGAPLLETDSGP